MIPPDENAMQKEGEAVRKSNVIIIAILMVASIAFLGSGTISVSTS